MKKQSKKGWKVYVPEWGHFDLHGIFNTKAEAWKSFTKQYSRLGYFPKNKPKDYQVIEGNTIVPEVIPFKKVRVGDIAFSVYSFYGEKLRSEGVVEKLYTGRKLAKPSNKEEKTHRDNLLSNGLEVEDIVCNDWILVTCQDGDKVLFNYDGDPSGVICLKPLTPKIIFTASVPGTVSDWGRFSMYGRYYHIGTSNGYIAEVTEEEHLDFITTVNVHPVWLESNMGNNFIPKALEIWDAEKMITVTPLSQPFVDTDICDDILILAQSPEGRRYYVKYDPTINSFYL